MYISLRAPSAAFGLARLAACETCRDLWASKALCHLVRLATGYAVTCNNFHVSSCIGYKGLASMPREHHQIYQQSGEMEGMGRGGWEGGGRKVKGS